MNKINLNDQLSIAAEQVDKQLRLIVFDGDEELVCHKTNKVEIKQFIDADSAQLFKGRLQLDKAGNHIAVKVRGTTKGIIALSDFGKLVYL